MIGKTRLETWINTESAALDGDPFGFRSAHLEEIDPDYSSDVDVVGCLLLLQMLDDALSTSQLRFALVVPLEDVVDPLGPLPSLEQAIRERDRKEPPGVYLVGLLNGIDVVGDVVLRELDTFRMASGLSVDVRLCLDKQEGDETWSRYVVFKRRRRDEAQGSRGPRSEELE